MSIASQNSDDALSFRVNGKVVEIRVPLWSIARAFIFYLRVGMLV